MPNAEFHRKIIHAIALLMFAVSSLLVVAPLALPPTTPLMDKLLGIDIPLQYQRALVVVQGACGLVGALLLLSFRPAAWYVLIATGALGVVHGLTSVPVFLPTFVNLIYLLYLFSVRPLYVQAGGTPAGGRDATAPAPAARSR